MNADPRFKEFMDDLAANGLSAYIYPSELWFYDQGLETFARRAASSFITDHEAAATKEEKLFATIFWQHFPQMKNRSEQIHKEKQQP